MKRLYFYAALLLLTQCSKCKNSPGPKEKLPPETQTGANTFGCLLNGQVWLPRGNDGSSNFSVTYDPNYRGGNIDIRAYRYTNDKFQTIILGGDGVNGTRTYSLTDPALSVFYSDTQKAGFCQDIDNRSNYCQGRLTFTRLDLRAGIISGTFDFVLAKPGCDTIKVTQGRFDKKL